METAPDVTILVPVLNEEGTIAEVVERLLALPFSKQIIVVNDGSTDNTPAILAKYESQITVLNNPTRTGKGAAIRKALPYAIGKTTIVQDADLEYVPEQIPLLTRPILEGKAKVVYGTRFANGLPKAMALPNKIVNVLLALSVRILYGYKITDEATCYKCFDTNLLKSFNLECKRFEFCPEVTAKALRRKEKILEVPIDYTPRSIKAGKKIRWTDAPEAFWTLIRHRFKKF